MKHIEHKQLSDSSENSKARSIFSEKRNAYVARFNTNNKLALTVFSVFAGLGTLKAQSFDKLYNALFQFERFAKESNAYAERVTGRYGYSEIIKFVKTEEDAERVSDLIDREGNFISTANGKRTSGELLLSDVADGPQTPTAPLLFLLPTLYPLAKVFFPDTANFLAPFGFAFLTYVIFKTFPKGHDRMLCMFSMFFSGATTLMQTYMPTLSNAVGINSTLLLAFLPTIIPTTLAYLYNKHSQRDLAIDLALQRNAFNLSLASREVLHEKKKQINKALNDKSPVHTLGYANGYMAALGDVYAPDAGTELKISENEKAVHTIVFGVSNQGKTSQVVIPDIIQTSEFNEAGMFLFDGKGTLVAEARARLTYVLDPRDLKSRFNPYFGLSPEQVARTLFQIQPIKDEKNPHFTSNGLSILTAMTTIYYLLNKVEPHNYKWAVLPHVNFMVNDVSNPTKLQAFRQKVLTLNDVSSTKSFELAIKKLESLALSDPAETEKFIGTINGWVSGWLENVDLVAHWLDNEETDCDVVKIYQRARIGIDTPENRYGRVGPMIQAFALERIMSYAKNRNENWAEETYVDEDDFGVVKNYSRAFLVGDECDVYINKNWLDVATRGRSLGLAFGCVSFQNAEQIISKIGEEDMNTFYYNIATAIHFDSTPKTFELLEKRLGTSKRLIRMGTKQYGLDYISTLRDIENSIVNDEGHEYHNELQHLRKDVGGVSSWYRNHLRALSKSNGDYFNSIKGVGVNKLRLKIEELQPTVRSVRIADEETPVLTYGQFKEIVKKKGQAVISYTRGNRARSDVITLVPYKIDGTMIQTAITELQEKQSPEKASALLAETPVISQKPNGLKVNENYIELLKESILDDLQMKEDAITTEEYQTQLRDMKEKQIAKSQGISHKTI